MWFAGKFRQEFGRTFQECTPLNPTNDRRPNQQPSYAYMANECRSASQSRREQFWHAEIRVSWVKKVPNTVLEGTQAENEFVQDRCSLGFCPPQSQLRLGWAVLYSTVMGHLTKPISLLPVIFINLFVLI